MTTPLIPYYDTLTIERDPADDHAFPEHVRVPGACVTCGVQVGDTWDRCEACRFAVADEGDL
jgi:hypothetical protein